MKLSRPRSVRPWVAVGAAGVTLSSLVGVAGISASAATPGRVELHSTLTPAAERAHPKGAVSGRSSVSFDLVLSMRDRSGAVALVKGVSDPRSAMYRHYLSLRQWESRFSPSAAHVSDAKAWLRSQGFKVGRVPADRLFVPARGTASQVERAFGTSLGNYVVNGRTVRLAKGALSIPASLSGVVAGVLGVNEYLATNTLAGASTPKATNVPRSNGPAQEPPPPAAFRNDGPCSNYYGETKDTSNPKYGSYGTLPYQVCGYKPGQLRSAYGLGGQTSSDNGTGVTVAIVDAYDSPTLLSNAQQYFKNNDSAHPLSSSQFFNAAPATIDDEAECAASGWFAEQSLDVEAVHSMAPGANILFVGAQDCTDQGLLSAVNTAVTSGASVVTDSWGDTLGDLFTDAATKTAFDDTFLVADGTGVSVLFSSGDYGDNFAISGLTVPDYPPTSPFVTAVGGTALEIGPKGGREAEVGWSTGKSYLCNSTTASLPGCTKAKYNTWLPGATYSYGGAGGTSYTYTQPWYQAKVVPAALALRNEALFGPVPLRVEPDISMDADPQTGMLIGLTETFPTQTGGTKTAYGQFKEGGTSLASPLLAGVIADTDQVAGVSLGFLNPSLYLAYSQSPSGFYDVVPPASPTAVARNDYADSLDTKDGVITTARILDYEGLEVYCDATGGCAQRDVALTTAKGFDSMTGVGSVADGFISTLAKF
jgi:subtilase family serine protease